MGGKVKSGPTEKSKEPLETVALFVDDMCIRSTDFRFVPSNETNHEKLNPS
jgi:hypothetical protein